MIASGSANRTVGCLRGRLRRDVRRSHSPESVACGYPDRSITRVGVSNKNSRCVRVAMRLDTREGPNFQKKKKKKQY